MACGVPVVSTNCPSGPDEIIENGINGVLVPTENVDELAIAIIKILKNQKIKQVFAKNSLRKLELFVLGQIIHEYTKLIGIND